MTYLQNKSDWLAKHLLGWRREYYKIYAVSFWERQDDKGFWSWHADGFIDKPIDPDLYTDSEGDLYEPLAPRAAWQPHEKIEQCFAYLIPAMTQRGFDFYLKEYSRVNDGFSTRVISATFECETPHMFSHNKGETHAAAIVEACYAALQKELK